MKRLMQDDQASDMRQDGDGRYGKQVGVIGYGGGINVRHWAEEARKDGFVVVFDLGFARIHEAKPVA